MATFTGVRCDSDRIAPIGQHYSSGFSFEVAWVKLHKPDGDSLTIPRMALSVGFIRFRFLCEGNPS
jgi:hypothetical protein